MQSALKIIEQDSLSVEVRAYHSQNRNLIPMLFFYFLWPHLAEKENLGKGGSAYQSRHADEDAVRAERVPGY